MATPTTASKLRSIYRSLLRELPPRPLLSTPRSPLHERLHNSFLSHGSHAASPSGSNSAAAGIAASTDVDTALAQAEQFLVYLRSQRMYTTLLERYNPGVGMDEEERVRLSARRVGLNLPVEFPEEKS